MSYVPVDSALPQNSRMPPPARCVDASNAAIALAEEISRNGRCRVYGTTPRLGSFVQFGPGVVASAALALPQSELARRSILSAGVPAADASTLQVGAGAAGQGPAPAVIPLNWAPELGEVGACIAEGSSPSLVPPMPSIVMPVLLGSGQSPRVAVERAGAAGRAAGRSGGRPAGFPRWSDAAIEATTGGGVIGWIERNPWLAVGIVALGVVAATGNRKQGRRF